ncbi:MAG: tetratricopeptide repeat protein [Candidatus Scalindua sp.]
MRSTKKNISPDKTLIDIDSEFTKAIQYHKSGQLCRAEEIYKRILEVNPNHSEALNLLGVIASQSGNNDIAVNLINKAIQYNPGNPIYYYHLGIILRDQGNHFPSRMSSSMLTALGLPELITSTLKEYESLAVDLARNPVKLQMIRQTLMKNRLTEPLFNTSRFTRNLEKAYKEMWKIFAAGEMPRQIEVVE